VFCPLLCCGKLGKDSCSNSLDCVLKGTRIDNLTKVIMEALTIGGGMPRNHVSTKLVSFGGNNVNVFQGTKFGVIK
jgi:hypothetical protein